jgi:hypothetical protein
MSAAHPILADMAESRGEARDLTNAQQAELRAYFDASLFAFAWTFFGFHDLIPGLHGQVCHLLERWGEPPTEPGDPGRRLMIQIPRGSYKTSLCTIANSLWQVSKRPDTTILICNEIVDNAKKWLRAMREVAMTSRLYQAVYGDLLPPGVHWRDREAGRTMPRWWKWNDNEIVFTRPTAGIPEASITAAGIGTATTGGHWDRIVKDDLISEDAKQSPTIMQRVREWFDSSLPLERPPYKGIDLVVCTPWSYDDVYRYILEKYDYKLYRRSAIELDPDTGEETSVMPNRWTVPELRAEERRDPFYFSSQLMCMPKAGRFQSFDESWLRAFYLEREADPGRATIVIPHTDYDPKLSTAHRDDGRLIEAPPSVALWATDRAVFVDPAAADPKATGAAFSRSGIVAVGIDPWGRMPIFDCWAGRDNPTGLVERIFAMCSRWSCRRVVIEEVSFSIVYQSWLRQHALRTGYHLLVTPVKPGNRNKADRIESLIPRFQNGLMYLNQGCQALDMLRREYIDYPAGATRDLLDALAYAPEVLRAPEDPTPPLDNEDEDEDPRPKIDGY